MEETFPERQLLAESRKPLAESLNEREASLAPMVDLDTT
jgi:hypothetical protein